MHLRLLIGMLALALIAPVSARAAVFPPASPCSDAEPGASVTAADTTSVPSVWQAAPFQATLTATNADHMQWRLDCGARVDAAVGETIQISAIDGTHVLSHRAIDAFGDGTPWVDDTIGVDSSLPTNTTAPPTDWRRPPVTVNVTGVDAVSGVDHVEYNLDGAGVQNVPSGSTVTITGGGPHTLATQVVDAAGNRSPLQTDTVRIDGTAPTDDTVVPTGWQSTPPTITVTGSDAGSGVGHVEWKLDGTQSSGADGATVTIPDGTHSFDTRIVDAAGNASAWSPHTVQVDVTGPQDDTTVPAGWQTAPVTVHVTGSDPTSGIDHVEWKLDGNPGSGPNNSAVTVSSDGVHTLQTRIVNSVGETSSWNTQYVRVDTLIPSDVTAVPSGWQTAPLAVDVTGGDATSGIEHVAWQIDSNSVQTSTTNPNRVTISADGVHTLKTRVYDNAGLASGWKTQTVRIDTTAPVNTTPVGSSAWRAADYAVVLGGGDGGSGLAEMDWQLDGGPVHHDAPGTQVTVSGTGAHTLTTWAVDNAGNASGPRDDAINIDTVPPTDTTTVPSGPVANHYGVSVTGTDAHSGIAQVQWKLDGGAVQTTPTATIDGFGTHTLQTQVVDNAGNVSGWTSRTITVSGVDATLPVDDTVVPTGWQTGAVTVTVAAHDDDTGVKQVQWRLDGDLHTVTAPSAAVTVTGDAEHELETRATDNAGNTSQWKVQTVDIDTKPPVDTSALPTGWTNATTFTLDGSDETSQVAQIEYSIDGTPGTTVPGGSITVTGDGSHTIKHRVVDNADFATQWKTDVVKIDTVKPVNTSPAAPTGWHTSPLQLALSGTDADSGFDHAEWRVDGGDVHQSAETDVATDGTPLLETRVVDNAGNASDWRPETVKIDTTAPLNTTPAPAARWQKDPYTVSFSGTDATSGVAQVEWKLDGGDVQTAPTVTIAATGSHTLESRVLDVAGNASDWRSDAIGIDPDAPTLTAACGPTAWQSKPVTCTVTADGGDSGLASLKATRGSGAAEDVHGGKYVVSADGEWPLTFRAVDGAGNASTATATVRVDRAAPQVHVSCVPDSGTAWACHATATDATSGVAKITYSVDGAPAQLTTGTFTVAKGSVVVRAVDKAGNVGAAPALALADRTPPPAPVATPAPAPKREPTPKPAATPRSRSAAVLSRAGDGSSRLLGELALASLPTKTTVDVRPLALGSGRFQVKLTVTADGHRKSVRKTVKLRNGYSPHITVRLGGAFSISAKLTVRRRVGGRWVAFAAGSARLG